MALFRSFYDNFVILRLTEISVNMMMSASFEQLIACRCVFRGPERLTPSVELALPHILMMKWESYHDLYRNSSI